MRKDSMSTEISAFDIDSYSNLAIASQQQDQNKYTPTISYVKAGNKFIWAKYPQSSAYIKISAIKFQHKVKESKKILVVFDRLNLFIIDPQQSQIGTYQVLGKWSINLNTPRVDYFLKYLIKEERENHNNEESQHIYHEKTQD
ncbi:UNKNOWN [Stylonychia lemnae]|uniref:Uncharacterized protein n=1 Tax=Stylonychia lemnae TaxID=5949 RepID=A0A078AH03_STYLE|nr:UNKNOWN [Stylonychia lemnae]|eukprot:CDW80138.1 UNKNOWN [Stylonychia lemnae]